MFHSVWVSRYLIISLISFTFRIIITSTNRLFMLKLKLLLKFFVNSDVLCIIWNIFIYKKSAGKGVCNDAEKDKLRRRLTASDLKLQTWDRYPIFTRFDIHIWKRINLFQFSRQTSFTSGNSIIPSYVS